VRSARDGALILVQVKARARRSAVLGQRNGLLQVALAAPPIDGRANDELLRLLAETLGVAKSRLELFRGGAARIKQVLARGVAASEASARLGVAVGDGPGGVESGEAS
jgi:uncharacterized protein (TIGR00251 family)